MKSSTELGKGAISGRLQIFVGGDAGNTHSFRVPASGDYIIDVHLLRFAARDYQSAQYTLSVALAE